MSRHELVISPQAKRDLEEIYAYTAANWGKTRAETYLDQLEAGFHQIIDHPESGRPRPEIKADYRALVKEKHVIFYRISGKEIHVLGVLHSRMDIAGRQF